MALTQPNTAILSQRGLWEQCVSWSFAVGKIRTNSKRKKKTKKRWPKVLKADKRALASCFLQRQLGSQNKTSTHLADLAKTKEAELRNCFISCKTFPKLVIHFKWGFYIRGLALLPAEMHLPTAGSRNDWRFRNLFKGLMQSMNRQMKDWQFAFMILWKVRLFQCADMCSCASLFCISWGWPDNISEQKPGQQAATTRGRSD